MRSPGGVAAWRGEAMRPEARSGAVERRAPAMALAAARAPGRGWRVTWAGRRRGGPRVGLRAGGRGDVVLPRGGTGVVGGAGGRVRSGGGHVRRWLGAVFFLN